MNKVLALLRIEFESASRKTSQFQSFCRVFKSEFTKELKSIGAKDIKFSNGHFCISGYFTAESGQVYYFSLPDVRGMHFMSSDRIQIMYRTAKDYNDSSGGGNQWVRISQGMAQSMSIR